MRTVLIAILSHIQRCSCDGETRKSATELRCCSRFGDLDRKGTSFLNLFHNDANKHTDHSDIPDWIYPVWRAFFFSFLHLVEIVNISFLWLESTMISFSYNLPTLFSHPSAAFSAEAFSHCFCHSLENRTVTKEWQQEPRLDFSYGSYQYQLPHDELSSQLAQCKKLPHVVLCSGTLSYPSLVFFSLFFCFFFQWLLWSMFQACVMPELCVRLWACEHFS